MTNLHVKELILKWGFLLVKSLGQWHTFWTCGLWIVYGKKNIGKKQNFNLKLIEFFFGENVEKKIILLKKTQFIMVMEQACVRCFLKKLIENIHFRLKYVLFVKFAHYKHIIFLLWLQLDNLSLKIWTRYILTYLSKALFITLNFGA